MATTSNTYTGNGSNKLFSITFPYLETTDVDVYLNGTLQTITTQYTFANATTIEFVAAPANGAVVLLDRSTDDATLQATFFPGSSIKAADLNLDFDQVLYIAQETSNEATTATSTAASATTTANTALSQSSAAVSTANTASSNASAAVSTANTASTNASNAVTTANTASSNATTAVNTANAATSTANSAASDASTALSTANTALTNANSAVTTANTASSNATAAVSTANTASTNASNAVTTANSAVTTANGAVTTANTADTNSNTAITTANAAAAAVANAVLYTTVANVAAIPASPANNAAVEVTNSTGIESFTPLSGLPAGFIGSSGLSVRIIYQTSGATWTWIQYFPNDPETRYLKLAGGTLTGALAHPLGAAATPSITFTGDTNTGIYSPGADQVAVATNGTGRLFVDASGRVGVGASNPFNALHVFGNTGLSWGSGSSVGGLLTVGSGSAGASLFIKTPSLSDSFQSGLGIDGSYSGGISTINIKAHGVPSGGPYGADLTFQTSNQTSLFERLRITSAGLVGVGTSVPDIFSRSHAQVVGISSASGNSFVEINGASGSIGGVEMGAGATRYGTVSAGASGLDLGTNAALPISLSTNNNTRVTIDSSGRCGIGTSTFTAGGHLEVQQPAGATGFAINAASGESSKIYLRTSGGGAGGVIQSNVDLIFSPSNTERVRIDSSGRVGIGTTSVNAPLHVSNGGAAGLEFYPATYEIQAYNRSTSAYGLARYNAAGHQFAVSGTEAARIDSSGRLGIGTSSPSTILEISAANAAIASDGLALLRSTSVGANTGGQITFGNAGARRASVAGRQESTDPIAGYLQFGTRGASGDITERFRISSTGAQSSVIPGGSTLYPQFGCRAWVNFNGTGTVAIRASGNVSSITDLAAGEYQVNFTTAMPDANYATNVTSSTNSGYDSDGFSLADVLSNLTTPHVTTAYVRVGTALAANGNGSDAGAVCMNVTVFR